MKITETIERECCQIRDLKPVAGSDKFGNVHIWMFCVHCGTYHKHTSYMDAAGSRDYEYRPQVIVETKEKK